MSFERAGSNCNKCYSSTQKILNGRKLSDLSAKERGSLEVMEKIATFQDRAMQGMENVINNFERFQGTHPDMSDVTLGDCYQALNNCYYCQHDETPIFDYVSEFKE